MAAKNNYDVLIISRMLQKEIRQNRAMTALSIIAFIFLLMILAPAVIWFFIAAVIKADLPFFDLNFLDMLSHAGLFLLPYSILLIYYFLVMYFKDKKMHVTNREHFKKATVMFVLTILTAFLPQIAGDHKVIIVVYFIFFVLTVYNLSMTYYDVDLSKAYDIHSTNYRNDDLGWFGGMLDDPFSYQDDINRTRLMVQSSTVGFDLIAIFIDTIVKSMVFLFASRDKKMIREAGRLFDYLLERNGDMDIQAFSVRSKVILETVGYLAFRRNGVLLCEKGKKVAEEARITL